MLLIITSDVSLTTKKLRNQYLQRREIYIYFYTRQQRDATRQVYFCLSIIMMERQTNGRDDNREQCSITIASSAIQTMETISVQWPVDTQHKDTIQSIRVSLKGYYFEIKFSFS